MNRILMTAAVAVMLTAASAHAQQNMIDPINPAPAPQPSNGVMYMNPAFDHSESGYTGPMESNRSKVSAAQAELKARGFRLKIDGVYGANTRAAVKKFQRSHKLRVDGLLGPQTLRSLGITD